MRISDWSSDVCSSDLFARIAPLGGARVAKEGGVARSVEAQTEIGAIDFVLGGGAARHRNAERDQQKRQHAADNHFIVRSEEHTSELQSLMRISYAVFCLKKKTNYNLAEHTPHYNTKRHTITTLT